MAYIDPAGVSSDRPRLTSQPEPGVACGVTGDAGAAAELVQRPEFWLNLQKLYELRLAERKNGPAIARLPTLDAGSGLHATG